MASRRPAPVRRTAAHPALSGTGAARPQVAFHSPFQPPAGLEDFLADRKPEQWKIVITGGRSWRVKVPGAAELDEFVLSQQKYNSDAEMRTRAALNFIGANLHPDDIPKLVRLMITPDGEFGTAELSTLVRHIATTGTARPFALSGTSLPSHWRIGGRSGPRSQRRG